MFPLDYALALALIVSPAELPEGPIDCPEWALWAVADGLGLVDERERVYLFVAGGDAENVAWGLRQVRERYKELRDAPPLVDALRWPSAKLCDEMIAQNRAALHWLEDRRAIDRGWWLEETILDCEELFKAWDCLRDIQCDYYYVTSRRAALKRLREMIGPVRYYAGLFPPAVPVWRFRRAE